MKKALQKIPIISVGLLTPVFVFAAAGMQTDGLVGFLKEVHGLIGLVIPILISLGVLAFMWGIVLYLYKNDKAEGKTFMLWGIIALFVMTSVWGLVGILRGTLFGNTDDVRNVSIPQLNTR